MGVTTLMSFAEFERLPDTGEHLELLEGELLQLPPPEKRHVKASHRIYDRARDWRKEYTGGGVGDVYMEMGYLMKGEPPSWLEPDVSVTDPDQPGDKYYQGAPMIAIEIISPSERSGEVQDKIRIYLTNGAKEVWTFYERNRTAYAYTPDGKFRIESAAFHSDLLPGLEIPFEEIFR